jgi:hypothetical protein
MLNEHTAKRSSSNRGSDGTCVMDFSSSEAKKNFSSLRVRGREDIRAPRDKKVLMNVCEAGGWKEEWGKPVDSLANNICFGGTQTMLDGDLCMVHSCHASCHTPKLRTHLLIVLRLTLSHPMSCHLARPACKLTLSIYLSQAGR